MAIDEVDPIQFDTVVGSSNGSSGSSIDRLTSFEQLAGYEQEFTITRPDKTKYTVRLRSMTDDERETLRVGVKWPVRSAFIKDMRRDAPNKPPVPVYDDDAFDEATKLANTELTYRLIVASLVDISVPGESLEEQAKYLRGKVASWAIMQMGFHIMTMAGINDEEVSRILGNLPLGTS